MFPCCLKDSGPRCIRMKHSNVKESILPSRPKFYGADIRACFFGDGRRSQEENFANEKFEKGLNLHLAADLRQEFPGDISQLVVKNGGKAPTNVIDRCTC